MYKINIFISYSHKDIQYKEELDSHLRVVERWYNSKIWSDKWIKSGEVFNEAISNKLNKSDMVIYLISSDFLNSSYCYDIEFQTIYEKHNYGDVVIIPVIVRPCGWYYDKNINTILSATFQGKSISEYENRDLAYLEIVTQVIKNIDKLNEKKEKKEYAKKSNSKNNSAELDTSVKGNSEGNNIIKDIQKFSDNYNNIFSPTEKTCEVSDSILKYFIDNYIKKEGSNILAITKELIEQIIGGSKGDRLIIDILERIYNESSEIFRSVLSEYINDDFFDVDADIIVDNYLTKNPLFLQTRFSRIINLLFSIPSLIDMVPNNVIISIKIKCSNNLDFYLMCYFLEDNIEDHLKKSLKLLDEMKNRYYNSHKWIENHKVPVYSTEIIRMLHKVAEEKQEIISYNNFVIEIVQRSHSYSYSQDIITDVLYFIIEDFDEKQCSELVNAMKSNSQFLDLGKSSYSNHKSLAELLKPMGKLDKIYNSTT